MTGPAAGAGRGHVGDPAARSTRLAKPPLEGDGHLGAGASDVPVRPAPLEDIIEQLAVPVAAGVDVVLTAAELEAQRQRLHQDALEMAEIRRDFGITLREHNQAHGFTPVATHRKRLDEVRQRGKGLNAEIDRDGRSSSSKTPSHSSVEKPKYSSPAKTLRAAEAARAELSGLSGEA